MIGLNKRQDRLSFYNLIFLDHQMTTDIYNYSKRVLLAFLFLIQSTSVFPIHFGPYLYPPYTSFIYSFKHK